IVSIFLFNNTPTTEIYTLSLHDALPICGATSRPDDVCVGRHSARAGAGQHGRATVGTLRCAAEPGGAEGCVAQGTVAALPYIARSEEHTSELQSRSDLVCRLLLEKKKKK